METGNANTTVTTQSVDVEDLSHGDQTRLLLMLLQDML